MVHSALGGLKRIGGRHPSDDSRRDHLHAVKRPNERTRRALREGGDDEKNFFPLPARGQGCKSLGARCQCRRMSNDTRAALIRVARPHCWSSWYVPITDPSAVRTPPQNGSATAPRSILR